MRAISSTPWLGVTAIVLSSGCAAAAPRPSTPASPVVSASTAACAVWDREVEFARSVQDHDARAFAEHVHPGAVFVEGDALQEGSAAITEGWKGLLAGTSLRIDWHPTSVVLAGDRRVALSRGPYWIERMKPDANPRFLTGVYQSVWSQGADGVWRVTIDGGTPEPVPATEADVARIKASLPARCPI